MSTTSDPTAAFREQAEAILGEERFRNFAAQSHSRDVLRQLRVPPEGWPQYTETLDGDLVYAGQTLLYLGLRIKTSAPTDGDGYLTRGAEILEQVYSRADNSDPERVCQLFSAALAYYMAGHFARAYVLVRDLEAEAPLPRFLRPIRHLLLKELRLLRGAVLSELMRQDYDDGVIAAAVAAHEIDEDQALCRILEATLYRALSHFLEHIRTGDQDLHADSLGLVDTAIEVSVAHKFADWWWYFSCIRILLLAYRQHSLWTNLGPFFARPESGEVARRYIHANLRLPTPVVELWPSQVAAIPHLFTGEQRRNVCLRMPTSAGKTKVAELAILSHLQSGRVDPDFKCVYVAPFRSLAVEVEQTLRQALMPLGLRVSQLYGGFELTATDRLLIEDTQILVATPEKFDAFLRFSPDLAQQVRLVILDEGHIISPPDYKKHLRSARGLKYEVFLQRLVARCRRANTQLVFLSAVMPNAEQFAEWITGDPNGLVASEWRPSRLMIGDAVWDGSKVDLEYTHADRKPLGQRCFVPGFIKSRSPNQHPGKRRRLPIPKDGDEALALTALEFARHKLTMVFVARKTSAEPVGRALLECIQRTTPLNAADTRVQQELDQCMELISDQLGQDSEHIQFLRAGFVVHHGGLPQAVRLALERLVRSGGIRLVVATTTLAQGVNFPIHTVLVHSLDHGQDSPVSPMDFWNICGRAGRGMKENEGHVLFFVREHFGEWQKGRPPKFKKASLSWQQGRWRDWCAGQKERRLNYIKQYGTYQVESGLLSLIQRVVDLWEERHQSVDVTDLCEALANNELDLFAPSEAIDLESVLSTLDGLLISLTEECQTDEITPDTFQDLLCRSLVHLQLATPDERQTIDRLFAARVRYIRGRYPDPAQRRRFYQLGLPLRDCQAIEEKRQHLLELYLRATDYDSWTLAQRASHLAEIGGELFQLSEIAPNVDVPASWTRILELWLGGQTPTDILNDDEVVNEKLSAHDLGRWVDDVFGYRLPWGFNSLSVYLQQFAAETGNNWPEVCNYFSAFVKYGVHEPVVCWLLGLGVPSRSAAARIGALVPEQIDSPETLSRWLQRGGLQQLIEAGLQDDDARLLRERVMRGSAGGTQSSQGGTVKLPIANLTGPQPKPGTHVLIEPGGGENEFRMLTLAGVEIATFKLRPSRLTQLLATPEFATSRIATPGESDKADKLYVRVDPI